MRARLGMVGLLAALGVAGSGGASPIASPQTARPGSPLVRTAPQCGLSTVRSQQMPSPAGPQTFSGAWSAVVPLDPGMTPGSDGTWIGGVWSTGVSGCALPSCPQGGSTAAGDSWAHNVADDSSRKGARAGESSRPAPETAAATPVPVNAPDCDPFLIGGALPPCPHEDSASPGGSSDSGGHPSASPASLAPVPNVPPACDPSIIGYWNGQPLNDLVGRWN